MCALLLGYTRPFEHISFDADAYLPPETTGTITKTYVSNGVARQYILYVPENLPQNAPLVIGMHGYTSSPWVFKNNFGWDELADTNKFIMCYPQGSIVESSGYSHWNAQLPISTVDDVGFLSGLALYLAREYQLDKNRIFATGFSNGGYMAYTLACERPDVFRAVASVSGLISEQTYKNYNPNDLTPENWLEYSHNAPVPICHIHGTSDRVVPYDGSIYLTEFAPGLSAERIVEFWVGINDCTQKETKQITDNVTATHYINLHNNNQVWYYIYDGWSHYWPSENYKVTTPSEINAQEIIWDFFSMYK